METDAEAAAERRSAYVGATVLAIITTGVMVAAVVENPRKFQFYFPPPDIGAAWLVAVATVN